MSLSSISKSVRQLARSAAVTQLADLSDTDLLARFRASGEEAVFEVLLRRHASGVLAASRRMLSNPADVEDVFQATFLVLLRNPHAVRRERCLGSWLFGIARRLALRARCDASRRTARESAASRPESAVPTDLSWREACELLRLELDRLPARYRLPLWMCYFEGRTRDEIALALGDTPGAVKGCLERGREVLRKRLARMGITLPAGLLVASAAGPVAGAVPVGLIGRTLASAVGTPPAAVTTLLRGFMVSTPSLSWLALVACIVLVGGLVSAVLPLGSADPPVATKGQSAPSAVRNGEPPREEKKELRVITGTVRDPKGKPVPAAKIYLVPDERSGKPLVEATAGPDGSFRLVFERDELAPWSSVEDSWRDWGVVAVADQFGPVWTRLRDIPRAGWEARLVPDLPIEGTLRNLEGKPVPGVSVSISHLRDWVHPQHLDEYLRELPTGRARYVPGNYWGGGIPGRGNTVVTDASGMFRLPGLGRDRLVTLKVGGSGIAWTLITVLARPGKTLRGRERPGREADHFVVQPASFDLPLPPGRTVTGVVKDDRTGSPVSGMTVWAGQDAPETTTDSQGRFTCDGIALSRRVKLQVTVAPGPASVGYLGTTTEMPASKPGLSALSVEVRVRKGIPVRARVVEKGSTRLLDADVRYLALFPNDNLPREVSDSRLTLRRQPDGTYAGACLPGPGAVVVRRFPKRYLPSNASHRKFFGLARMPNEEYGGSADDLWVAGFGGSAPFPMSARQFQSVAFINPRQDVSSVELTLELDPGETRLLRLTDADSRPLSGVQVKDSTEEPWSEAFVQSEREVRGIGAGSTRMQFLRQEEKKLAAVIAVGPDTPTPTTVKLRPWGTVTGRVIGWTPGALARVVLYGLPEYAVTDEKGRFRIERLPPGHAFQVRVGQGSLLGRFPRPVKVEPGQTLDLGDVELQKLDN